MEAPPDQPKKRTRTGAPKVRTGCVTWARHVKCDEAKPHCQRCKANGYQCHGYRPVLKKMGKRGKRKEKKVEQESRTPVAQGGSVVVESFIRQFLLSEAYESPSEVDLFHHVRTCMVPEFATTLTPTEFWSSYALPLGHTVKPIRAALCALGSAHKLFKIHAAWPKAKVPYLTALEEFSIQQYNEAINHINHFSIKAANSNLEMIIICCIIFISLENLLGRYAEARRHLRAAFRLLQCWEQSSRKENDHLLFETLSVVLLGHGQDICDYAGYQALPEMNHHSTLLASFGDTSKPFESVSLAIKQLRILRFALESSFQSAQQDPNQSSPSLCNDSPLPGHATPSPNWFQNSPQNLISFFYNWNDRFEAFKRSLNEKYVSDHQRYQILSLSLQQELMKQFIKTTTAEEYLPGDGCARIVEQVEKIIDSNASGTTSTFSFDSSLIPGLYLAGVSCDDASIQRKATKLLRSMNRREGSWNSQEMASFIEAIIYGREKGLLAPNDIPWCPSDMAALLSSIPTTGFEVPIDTIALRRWG